MVDFEKLRNQTPKERKAARDELDAKLLAVEKKQNDTINDLCKIGSDLTVWESNFADSVAKSFDRDQFLSDKQWAVVERILKEKG